MQYSLVRIEELEQLVTVPPRGAQEAYELDWQLDLKVDSVPTGQVQFHLRTSLLTKRDTSSMTLARFVATHTYQVQGISVNTQELEQDHAAFNLIATLLGVSLGTTRGLLLARTTGLLGPDVIMPIVNPSDMLRQALAGGGR